MARRWLRLIAMIGTVHIAKSATSLGCWLRILAIIAPRNCVLASVYEVAVGVVGDPTLGEVFRARRGGGAYRNDVAIHATSCSSLAEALVGTGFGYRADRRRAQAHVLQEVLPEVRDIRRMGSAAIDLCSVACGRLDAYYEYGISPWDIAAGSVIVVESGATVTDLAGQPTLGPMIVAAAAPLYGDLCDLLRAAGADKMPP